ncbi:hypothetical protein L2E82_03507 [Cichorium intybus]|uniref:Uncharacterized protein n=1 Tax=Cichorium intybus TaxID=13427 RepID=A0ACB9H446_CICIN|nr:hypothetical protein L2E82_03507 [Cichorium intybus]
MSVVDEEEELKVDEFVSRVDPTDQTQPPVRVSLLLAFVRTGVIKEGFTVTVTKVYVSGSDFFSGNFLAGDVRE